MADNNNQGFTDLSDGEMATMAERYPEKAYLIADLYRPGYVQFIQELEYTHYVPDSERNGLFEMLLTNWQGMVWGIVVIPLSEFQIAEEMGKKYNFRLAKGCIPFMIGAEGEVGFPMKSGDNVFSVQGFLDDKAMLAAMTQKMVKVMDEHEARVRERDANGPVS